MAAGVRATTALVLGLILSMLVVTVAFAQDVTDDIDALMRAGKWDEALTKINVLLLEDPENGMAWYQAGITRMQMKQNAEAAEAFTRSAELSNLIEFAWYNAACAHALNGDVDAGLECLEKAMVAGFDSDETIETDTDIASLRASPRFKEIYVAPVYEPHPWAEPVMFTASDGAAVGGVLYRARKDGRPVPSWDNSYSTIILCHQSGSNYAEYVPIAPKLAEMGFHCVSIDMRGGGKKYGRVNDATESWQRDHEGQRGGGAQAQLDIEGTMAGIRAEGFEGKIMLWGSSYSAGRLFAVVVDHPDDVAASLSFSPGRGFVQSDDETPSWASRVTIPVFMTWPESEFNESRRKDFEQLATTSRVLLIQEGGRHGSSTLHPDKNPDGVDAVWAKVTAFLNAYGRPD